MIYGKLGKFMRSDGSLGSCDYKTLDSLSSDEVEELAEVLFFNHKNIFSDISDSQKMSLLKKWTFLSDQYKLSMIAYLLASILGSTEHSEFKKTIFQKINDSISSCSVARENFEDAVAFSSRD